jgi:Zn-dependent protease with chaperone function
MAAALVGVLAGALVAQTKIVPPKNKYTPEQDVKLGKEAAAEVEKQLPIIRDDMIASYLERVGQRLVDASPDALNNPVFEYSFTPVDLKDINAFALPGGPMFVHRGMIEASDTEAETVGVMAHELAHVLLRHGTANATKAQNPWLQLGALGGAIAGAVVGGTAGAIIADGSQFGLGAVLLKYSREYEKQADLLGVQIMAQAGYEPRALARMFETIEKQSKGRAPQWLSSHPNPGNRTAYIMQEAAQVDVVNPVTDTSGFDRVRRKFASMSPAMTAEEAARRAKSGGAPVSVGRIGEPVPPPSSQYRTARGGQLFEVSVPANWQALSSENNIKWVPMNAYGQVDGRSVFTHGVEIGVARNTSRDIGDATDRLLEALQQSNPDLRQSGEQRFVRISGRSAIFTPLTTRSDATGREERVTISTLLLADGNLFYYVSVVPADEAGAYRAAFQRVGESIRLYDRR